MNSLLSAEEKLQVERILISAGHGGIEKGSRDPGATIAGTTEAKEMILLRDQIVSALHKRGFNVLAVPDALSMSSTIQWINANGRRGDVALEIHANAYSNPSLRGAAVFYIANNTERKKHAELLLNALRDSVPELPSRGTISDKDTGFERLEFCRKVVIPSLLMEVGFLTNPDDRALLQTRRGDFARGIADGLAKWSLVVSGKEPEKPQDKSYPPIQIKLNDLTYQQKGILINGNAYVPVSLAEQLKVDWTNAPHIRPLQYQGVIYVRAIELREYSIAVSWDNANRAVILRQLSQIAGKGITSEAQLQAFLKANNQAALEQFSDVPKLYIDEAKIEGINHDIAFCQMCLETNFLRFSGDLKSIQNNFGGLGTFAEKPAAFPSARLGIRAHIQHLKAYANQEPLAQQQVDPRFGVVARGSARTVEQLSGKWSADKQYGERLMAVIKRLYESARVL